MLLVFSFDASAQQRLDGFSPNLYQQTSLRCYSLMVVLVPHENRFPKVLGPKTSIFGPKVQTRRLRTATARKPGGILEKLKHLACSKSSCHCQQKMASAILGVQRPGPHIQATRQSGIRKKNKSKRVYAHFTASVRRGLIIGSFVRGSFCPWGIGPRGLCLGQYVRGGLLS